MKIFNISLLTIFLVFTFISASAQGKKSKGSKEKNVNFELQNKNDSTSYAIGMDIGINLSSQNIEVVPEALAKGIIDYINKNELLISEEAKVKVINEFQEAQMEKQQQMANLEAEKNKEASKKFLEDNKKQDGINVTESGLQYRVITEGTGAKPTPESNVTVHYEGKLIDGTVFDSSYKRGETISFPLSGVIPGWTEGLQLMKEGGKIELFIPSELGYGERGAGNIIPGNSTLIFTVELKKVN